MTLYDKNGFVKPNHPHIKTTVSDLRNRIISVFNRASIENGSGKINNDDDICKLYIENKTAWIAAYDIIRMLPEAYCLAGSPVIVDAIKECGVFEPALSGADISIRVDMPAGEGSMPFPPHQDYPYNKGSSNGVVVWIPLQDTDEKLGCLKYSPRSHEAGFIPGVIPGTPRLEGMVLSEDYVFEDIPMLAGELLIFSMYLVHKSGVNSTKSSIRFSVQLRFNDLSNSDFAKRGFQRYE